MYKEFEYKKQGDGSDSWAVTEWEDETKKVMLNKYMVYDFEVKTWKLKAELSNRGLLSQVEIALSGLPEPLKTQAGLAWEYSPTVKLLSNATGLIQQVLKLDKDAALKIFLDANDIEI